MIVMNEDKERVKLLLNKFSPRILRLAVNFISFDATVQELRNYLLEHKDFRPDQRELLNTLSLLDGSEVKELVILSGNIVNKGYELNDIIPLDK